MLTRYITILIALALMPVKLEARLQDSVKPPSQEEVKALRIFVEGEPSAAPAVIEEMRRRAGEYGLKIAFVSKATDTYDVRVILSSGTGQTWDTNPSDRIGDIRFPVRFAFSAAVVLTAEGKTAFTVAQSGNTAKSASVAVAKEVIKNLYRQYDALGKRQNSTDAGQVHSKEGTAPGEAISSARSTIPGLPTESGVYYEGPSGWIRLEQVSPSAVEHRGVGTALLTWGFSGVRAIQLYEGAQSRLQIQDRRPTFYVRGFGVSEQGGAIVRLATKKGQREIVAASIKPFNAKAGYSEHDVCEVVGSRVSSDVVAITPRTELKTGEYLLTFTSLELSYDFGIAIEKK